MILQTNSGLTRAFTRLDYTKAELTTEMAILGSDDGNLKLMTLQDRQTTANFKLKSRINAVQYIQQANIIIVGFESGLLKSFELSLNDNNIAQAIPQKDLFKLYSMKSKETELTVEEEIVANGHRLKRVQMFKVFSSPLRKIILNDDRE